MAKTLEQVRELFPEAEQITDTALREKVYRTWLKTWEMSSYESLSEVTFLPGALPDVDNITHTRTVVAMSLQFAQVMKTAHGVEVNTDHLIAGALLHDLGKYLRPPADSAKIMRLMGHAFSAAYIAIQEELPVEVVHIISSHSAEGELIKRTTEAAIVHYMDQAYTEVIFRAKTNINREEFHKLRKHKQMLHDEAEK